MWTLVRYCRLPSHQKRLLHAALAWVVLSKIGLALFSLPRLQRFTSNIRRQSLTGATRDELRWAVLAVARRMPGTRCLPRALALHALMARAGLPARLCIGVAKESDSALAAHAWVLHEGVPVFDEPDLERYTLLSAFPA